MGDPLGGCCISPFGYSLMLNKLMRFAEGKIVMALEGGYNLNSMSVSVLACMKTLLDEKHIDGSVGSRPFESTWHVIQEVRNVLKPFWPILCVELRQDILINNSQLFPVKVNGIYISDSDVEHDEAEVDNVDGVILPLTELTINNDSHEKPSIQSDLRTEQSSVISSERGPPSLRPDQVNNFCVPWRSTLSKIEVWYASFGSNMWKDRFLCYIEGGKVDGMNTYCNGSRDKSFPTDVVWKIVPHKLFFARSHNSTWGAGGVSFLHPESNSSDRAYMCLYKITLEQFNDVLLLENRTIQQLDSPLLDASQLDLLSETKTMVLEGLKGGWYSNVLYLGIEDGIPILTMTCPFSDIEQYKSGGLPLCAPSKEYVNTLVKGLVLGKQLTEEEAIEYIKNATITKL